MSDLQNTNEDSQPKRKKRKFLMQPIYIVLDDETQIRGAGEIKVIKKSELPKTGKFYAITSDGIKIHKEGILSGLAKIDQIAPLADVDANIKLNLPKVPAIIMKRAWHFFDSVFSKIRSESEVCLLYNKEENKYDLYCPIQKVSHGAVHYEMGDTFTNERPEGYNLVGTIHSHCDFSAYHSGTDLDDEKNFDGIHITIGHVNSDTPSLASSAVLGENRYTYEPTNMCLGWKEEEPKFKNTSKWAKNDQRYVLELTEEQELEFQSYVTEIEQWVEDRVSKIFYNTKKTNYYSGWDGFGNDGYTMPQYGGANHYLDKLDEYNLWDSHRSPDDYNDLEEDGQYRFIDNKWVFLSTEKCNKLDQDILTLEEIIKEIE